MGEKFRELYSNICKFESDDEIIETRVPYVKIYKSAGGKTELPVLSEPSFYYIISGSVQIYSDKLVNSYSQGEFFVSKLEQPFLTTINNKKFISVISTFHVNDIISVLLDADNEIFKYEYDDIDIHKICKEYSEKFADILIRVFEYANSEFMIKHVKKEFIYEIINTPYGKTFIENSLNIQLSEKIFNVNTWIKQNYKKEFSVEDLALHANMSVSNFHQKFKASIGMGPIQCQKKLRLVEARRLMLDKSANVTSAALEVGYESISQFISDYRRMFGCSPQKDIQEIRKCLITGANSKTSSR